MTRNKNQIDLIKQSGMRLEPLAQLLEIPLDTMKSYSIGRRTMPEELTKKLEKLIKKIQG